MGALLLFAIALGSARGEGKPRAAALSKKVCFRICMQMNECQGFQPDAPATLAELDMCVGDCRFESKDEERRPGWLCASRAEGCEALKKCEAGGRTKKPE